jgi:hypothetical protein
MSIRCANLTIDLEETVRLFKPLKQNPTYACTFILPIKMLLNVSSLGNLI